MFGYEMDNIKNVCSIGYMGMNMWSQKLRFKPSRIYAQFYLIFLKLVWNDSLRHVFLEPFS
jgi:hypothetical protein